MKKLLSLGLVLLAIFSTTVPTPAYAAATPMYETSKKVASAKLSGVYYYDLSIQNGNKLIATGKYARREDATKHTVQLQLTKPVTYTSLYVGTDGIARVEGSSKGIEVGSGWELKTTIPVVRSTSTAGDKKISMEINLEGLADGGYSLQEVVSKGGKKEGSFGGYLLVVVHKGIPSFQATSLWHDLTHWWHDTGFYIS